MLVNSMPEELGVDGLDKAIPSYSRLRPLSDKKGAIKVQRKRVLHYKSDYAAKATHA